MAAAVVLAFTNPAAAYLVVFRTLSLSNTKFLTEKGAVSPLSP
jgi:hypothetical protein